MKKVIMILSFLILISSCQMFLLDSTEWTGPLAKKGQADHGFYFPVSETLGRKREIQTISGYKIAMPENMVFKYGSTVYGTDVLFGKKRQYLYDKVNKMGTSIYLIEGSIQNIRSQENNRDYVVDATEKNGRYKIRVKSFSPEGGVLIEIRPNLYVACQRFDRDSYVGTGHCEAIAKIMKE